MPPAYRVHRNGGAMSKDSAKRRSGDHSGRAMATSLVLRVSTGYNQPARLPNRHSTGQERQTPNGRVALCSRPGRAGSAILGRPANILLTAWCHHPDRVHATLGIRPRADSRHSGLGLPGSLGPARPDFVSRIGLGNRKDGCASMGSWSDSVYNHDRCLEGSCHEHR